MSLIASVALLTTKTTLERQVLPAKVKAVVGTCIYTVSIKLAVVLCYVLLTPLRPKSDIGVIEKSARAYSYMVTALCVHRCLGH